VRQFQRRLGGHHHPVLHRAHAALHHLPVEAVTHRYGARLARERIGDRVGVALTSHQHHRSPHHAPLSGLIVISSDATVQSEATVVENDCH
jgi:hypothetical protein